ncbi:MAG TPA: amidohydrolase, partial [Candidatus Limnocylindrales bacterium]|nr:amidohydrolase [Candidatus Limnocylindrales bacterium]
MPDTSHADLILKGATVITLDAAGTTAQAVAVQAGRIVAVGPDADVEGLAGRATRVLDCRGKTVVPGFIDSHTHSTYVGDFRYSFDQLNTASELNPTVPALLAKVRERAAQATPGDWIGGRNYDPNGMQEGRWPTRHELDAVAPGNPVLITIRGGHACVANTRALELAGITHDTPDPEGGVIDRDESGDLTGVLRDVHSIRAVPPPATLADVKDGLARLNHMYLKLGITSTHDCGAAPRPESYRAYAETVAEHRWQVRTALYPYLDYALSSASGMRPGTGDDRLRMGGVKLFMDGSIQCFTCAFRERYVDRDTRGWEGLRYSQDKANEAVAEAHRRGYQVAIHAQGDWGITLAVNAIEHAMERHPRPDPRHRIEHTLCPTLEDLQRMQRLGIIPNLFLFHPWFWGDQHIKNFIGPERAARMVPARTAIDLGLHPCAHSDCPVCTPDDPVWPSNPLWAMACATT